MNSKYKSPRAVVLTAVFLFTITTLSATAQSWTNRYNGPGNGVDWSYAIAVDGGGNVYVTGASGGIGTDHDYTTIAYTSAGVSLWTNRYSGPGNGNDRANAITVDSSGNVYVTGESTSSGSDEDYATIKYSSAGVPLWTKCYNGSGNSWDKARAIAVDSSGNVYVTGSSQNASPQNYDYEDYATIKYSSDGAPLWIRRYNGPANYRDSAGAIAVDGSGNVYVTGTSLNGPTFGGGSGDWVTIAYSSAGIPLWTKRYNGLGNAHDGAVDIAVDGSGNVYVTGNDSPTADYYRYDYFTIAYTSAGVLRWTRRYNGPGNGSDEIAGMALDSSGNVYVTGSSPSSGGDSDYLTIKYASTGVPLWTNRYNGPGNAREYANGIAVDANGNVYVTGISIGNEWPAHADYMTVAYSSDGVLLWSRRYNGPGNGYDRANAIAADSSGNVYVTGESTGSGSDEDYATIKYVPPLFDHFTWSTSPSPKVVDVPFPVTLTATYLAGTTVTSFTGTVTLSGCAPGIVATNVSIGTGTDPWGYPLHTSYHDARTQVIYPADALGQACTINSLALEVTTPPGQTLENWTLRMKHTSLSEYPDSPQWESSGWTVVYRGNEPAGSTGWRTFEFSTPFEYDGTNNLLVDISFNNAFYSSEGQCESTDMGSYRSITFTSDSKDGDPLTWSDMSPTPTRSYNAPNLVLDVRYPDLLPVSFVPTNTTPFVNGVWTGKVTVHEAVSNLVLRASDSLGHEGESTPFDVEAVSQPPVIVTDDGQMGISNGCFGFNVQGQAGQTVVIEVSTNLVDWLPLQTNMLGGSRWFFSDPDTVSFTRRFYRAVTP